ncbi:MAG: hypothetical protein D6729_16480 [Deltaproteobacteria bacterium]|nr:MAG: hypothetical protein D6729_16480 [Deltaproteobacteria bacterium]
MNDAPWLLFLLFILLPLGFVGCDGSAPGRAKGGRPPGAGAAEGPSQQSEDQRREDSAPEVDLVFSADLMGYLEPCGCVKGQLGGLARAAAVVEGLGPGALWITAGDTFLGEEPVTEENRAQLEAKAEAIAEILGRLGARDLGSQRDDALGRWAAWSRGNGLLAPGAPVRAHLLEPSGIPILLVAARGDDGATLVERIASARPPRGATPRARIAVVEAPLDAARHAAAKLAGRIDLMLVAGHRSYADGLEATALERLPVPLYRTRSQGRQLLHLRLRLPAGAGPGLVPVASASDTARTRALLEERIERLSARREAAKQGGDTPAVAFLDRKLAELRQRLAAEASGGPAWPEDRAAYQARFIDLSTSLPEAPWARARIDRYDKEVGALNLAWSRTHGRPCTPPADDGAYYVGGASCVGCHAPAQAVWEGTRHAQAWQTLVDAGKEADLECVGCHVTGWQRPGGACRLHLVTEADPEGHRSSGLQNVQCEACHGPGSLHLAARTPETRRRTIRREVPEAVCRSCHLGDHSPHFDDARYRPRILGPGHGLPAEAP